MTTNQVEYQSIFHYLIEIKRNFAPSLQTNQIKVEEILTELEDHILDTIDEKYGENPIDNTNINEVLKNFGNPKDIAEDYNQTFLRAPQSSDGSSKTMVDARIHKTDWNLKQNWLKNPLFYIESLIIIGLGIFIPSSVFFLDGLTIVYSAIIIIFGIAGFVLSFQKLSSKLVLGFQLAKIIWLMIGFSLFGISEYYEFSVQLDAVLVFEIVLLSRFLRNTKNVSNNSHPSLKLGRLNWFENQYIYQLAAFMSIALGLAETFKPNLLDFDSISPAAILILVGICAEVFKTKHLSLKTAILWESGMIGVLLWNLVILTQSYFYMANYLLATFIILIFHFFNLFELAEYTIKAKNLPKLDRSKKFSTTAVWGTISKTYLIEALIFIGLGLSITLPFFFIWNTALAIVIGLLCGILGILLFAIQNKSYKYKIYTEIQSLGIILLFILFFESFDRFFDLFDLIITIQIILIGINHWKVSAIFPSEGTRRKMSTQFSRSNGNAIELSELPLEFLSIYHYLAVISQHLLPNIPNQENEKLAFISELEEHLLEKSQTEYSKYSLEIKESNNIMQEFGNPLTIAQEFNENYLKQNPAFKETFENQITTQTSQSQEKCEQIQYLSHVDLKIRSLKGNLQVWNIRKAWFQNWYFYGQCFLILCVGFYSTMIQESDIRNIFEHILLLNQNLFVPMTLIIALFEFSMRFFKMPFRWFIFLQTIFSAYFLIFRLLFDNSTPFSASLSLIGWYGVFSLIKFLEMGLIQTWDMQGGSIRMEAVSQKSNWLKNNKFHFLLTVGLITSGLVNIFYKCSHFYFSPVRIVDPCFSVIDSGLLPPFGYVLVALGFVSLLTLSKKVNFYVALGLEIGFFSFITYHISKISAFGMTFPLEFLILLLVTNLFSILNLIDYIKITKAKGENNA